MAGGRPTPIVVGVGDLKSRSQKIEDAIEPKQLILRAILLALKDRIAVSSHEGAPIKN